MLYSLDLSILYFFNITIASPTLDTMFNVLTNVKYWYPIYVFAGVWIIWRSPNRKDAALLVLGAVALVAFTDSLTHYFIKPWVGRARPCSTLPNGQPLIDWLRLPIGKKLDPSFPSSHALNNMAVAIYFVMRYKSKATWLVVIAVMIGLGRMYEGVHYPSDVLAGFIFGAILGAAWYALLQLVPGWRGRHVAVGLNTDRAST